MDEHKKYMEQMVALRENYGSFIAGVHKMKDCYLKRVILKFCEYDRLQREQTGSSQPPGQDGLNGVMKLFQAAFLNPELFFSENSIVNKALIEAMPVQREETLMTTRSFLRLAALSAIPACSGVGYLTAGKEGALTGTFRGGVAGGVLAFVGVKLGEDTDNQIDAHTLPPIDPANDNSRIEMNGYLLDVRTAILKKSKGRV